MGTGLLQRGASGRPLDRATRSLMESRFGQDFGGVRVHTDTQAARSAQHLRAGAYTLGRDISFAAGQYRPGSTAGLRLLAHELAHVVQQGNQPAPAQAALRIGEPGDSFEQEAERVATGLLGGSEGRSLPLERDAERLGPAASEQDELLSFETDPPGGFQQACSPTADTYENISKLPGAGPGVFGYTKPGHVEFDLKSDFKDGTCRAVLDTEPKLVFDYFVYTKEGTYRYGTETASKGPCKGKTADRYVKLTAKMADRIKEGEIEHCRDAQRAFELSYGKYAAAAKDLAAGFSAKDKKTCGQELLKRLEAKVGFATSKWKTVADCLFDKTLERDESWHVVELGEPVFSRDCKKATVTPDPARALPEIGKHPSDEVVKGCT